jgi:hypothetical protein
MLPVSLDCSFVIAPSVFSNVYYATCIFVYLYFFTHTCVQYNFHIISYFVDRCLSLCTYSVGHCVACSSMHGFWLSIWYLQTLQHTLNTTNPTKNRFVMCLVYPMLSLSLDCSFLIASSVFSTVYYATCISLRIPVSSTISISYHMIVSFNSSTTGVTSGVGTPN